MGSHGEHGEVGRCQRIREQPSSSPPPTPDRLPARMRTSAWGPRPKSNRARQYPENPLLAYG